MSDGGNQGWNAPGDPNQSGWAPGSTPPYPNPPFPSSPTGPAAPSGPGESSGPPPTTFNPTFPPASGAPGGYPGQFTPPYQPAYGPPGGSVPGAPLPGAVPPPPSGGISGRTLAIIIVVLVLVAGGVIGGIVASRGHKHHTASATKSTPATSPLLASSPGGSASSSASEATSPSTSGSPSGSTSGSGVPSLLSITPFAGCQNETVDTYPDVTATDAIDCQGSDIAAFSAQEVVYERFASATDLSTWYANDVLARNSIAENQGDCASAQVVSTTAQAEYCEGSFTDDTGATARQMLILAPIAVNIQIGQASLSTTCAGQQAYSLLIFTSPSDDVGGGIIACSGAAATAKAFETALQNGELDLHD